MASNLLFLTKVLVVSIIIAILIKTIGPALSIPATATSALLSVLGVPLMVLAALMVRLWRDHA